MVFFDFCIHNNSIKIIFIIIFINISYITQIFIVIRITIEDIISNTRKYKLNISYIQ